MGGGGSKAATLYRHARAKHSVAELASAFRRVRRWNRTVIRMIYTRPGLERSLTSGWRVHLVRCPPSPRPSPSPSLLSSKSVKHVHASPRISKFSLLIRGACFASRGSPKEKNMYFIENGFLEIDS